jgi:hypothetical protein
VQAASVQLRAAVVSNVAPSVRREGECEGEGTALDAAVMCLCIATPSTDVAPIEPSTLALPKPAGRCEGTRDGGCEQ